MRRLAPLSLILVFAACATPPRAEAPASSPAPSAQPASMSQTATEPVPPPAAAPAEDPYLWLEEVEGERAMAWVKEHNAKTLGTLQGDARFERLQSEALRILEATDRIAAPGFRGRTIYNFWQDKDHVRGLLRRTTLASYRTATPKWETVLDVDALSKSENANWVYRGANCLAPEERYCLISLSNGGKDATEMREFDMVTKAFVPNGFKLPESKGGATWVDRNTLLVSRNFGDSTVTKSGYPFTTRRLTRGGTLEAAPEIFRGKPEDVSAGAFVLRDADGKIQGTFGNRGVTFYEGETWLLDGAEPVKLPFPVKSSIQALVDDQLVFTTEIDWNEFKVGDLLAYDLSELKANPASAKAYLILRPGPREAIEGVTSTRNRLVVALYENVKGAVYVYDHNAGKWTRTKLALPEASTIGLGSSSNLNDQIFITVSNYVTPNSLWLADASTGKVEKLKSIPERCDASKRSGIDFTFSTVPVAASASQRLAGSR